MMEVFLEVPYPVWVGTVFLFGLIVGSFCNVCIYRLPRDESVVFPSSRCPHCNEQVRARDNIPVLSYIFLGGKCRDCKQPISMVYPGIEIVTALAVAGVFLQFGFSWEFLIYSIVCPALVIITLVDYRHKIIPDRITLPGIIFGFGAGFYLVGILDSIFGFLLGGGLFYLLAILSNGGMGGGDIKFIAAAGALLGWKKILLVIFLGAVLGSVVGLTLMALGKKGRKSQIPFGPFLAAGVLITIFAGDDLIQIYLASLSSKS